MLVVLASRFDADAARLVERWRERGAYLLTCDALSRPGWIHRPHDPGRSQAVLEGSPVPVEDIRGVLSLLPQVGQFELPRIVAEERAYVASETMAFLLAWLSSLPCTVLNRPTPLNLTGPAWYPEQWLREGTRAGLPTRPSHRSAPCFADVVAARACSTVVSDDPPGRPLSIALVGERCFLDERDDPPDAAVVAGVQHLAVAAGVDLITANFVRTARETTFVGAVPSVNIAKPEIANAVIAHLEARS